MDSDPDSRNSRVYKYSPSARGRPEICAVIVSYKSPENVISCIDSSVGQVDKVVVIDNSADSHVKDIFYALPHSDKISFLFNENNKGLAAALNRGLKDSARMKYRWTLLLDQDSILVEDMVPEMIRSYESLDDEMKEKTAVVVPTVFDRNFKEVVPSVITTSFLNKKIKNPPHDSFVHFHITSGSLIKNEVLPEIGFMNEHLFIDYVDFDYCFRVMNRGYGVLLSKNAVLRHSLADRRRKIGLHFREHNAMRVYYQTRNRLFVSRKYGKKYRSFLYSESCRSIGKLFKIVLLESDKREKLKMYFKGIRDFIREYHALDTEY